MYDNDEYRARKRDYMRARRAACGDGLKAQERAARTAYRATPAGREARRREYRNRSASTAGTARPSAPFVGVDGEGGDDLDGVHNYLLLRAGDAVLETGKPLTWQDCFGFLADLDPTAIYVAYFFDYDVTMMCATMPPYKVSRLLDREKRFTPGYHTPLPLDIGPYEIDYVKGKCFKVRRAVPKGEKRMRWVEISDVGRFFQTSFARTLADWDIGTPEQRADILAGKAARAEFGQMTDDIRRYNRLEVDLLERLMNKFRATCAAIGHQPVKWQGPGDLASSLLQYHRVPKKTTLPIWENEPLLLAANASYYGGRFETSAVGTVPGPVYNVDINSAYPYAMMRLPCLVHGVWEHTGLRPVEHGTLRLCEGYFMAGGILSEVGRVAFYGLPVRGPNGGVSFPGSNGNGVYWSFEIDAARHQTFALRDSWTYRRECDCDMFPWVLDLYHARLRLKKDSQGKVLKLALNSLYGKMAQRIGTAPYNNYIWSSFITAYCRMMLQEFIHSLPGCQAGRCGSDVLMLATDGIYCTALPEGFQPTGDLGGWDLSTYPDGIFIVQPGLYLDNRQGADYRLRKTRGLPLNKVIEYEGQLRAAFTEVYETGNPTATTVPIPLENFIGIRQATHRRKPELAGQWITETRNISFDWRSKRQAEADQADGHLRTQPPEGTLLDISRPYDRALAKQLDRNRIDSGFDFSEQPDFRAQVITAPETDL